MKLEAVIEAKSEKYDENEKNEEYEKSVVNEKNVKRLATVKELNEKKLEKATKNELNEKRLRVGETQAIEIVNEVRAQEARECERKKRAQVARVSPEKDVMLKEFLVRQFEEPQHLMVNQPSKQCDVQLQNPQDGEWML